MIIFRQLFDRKSSTYTYLLADRSTGEAVLIDPVFEQFLRDRALIDELGLTLKFTLDTHMHADHVTGAWLFKECLGSEIVISGDSGAELADRYVAQGDRLALGGRWLEVRATPGHTDGCVTYVLDDQSMAFTGDCLLIRGAGRTDFQQGNARKLYQSVHQQIFSLPDECLIWPAHDYQGRTVTTVGEEKQFNPRLGGHLSVHDFEEYMKHLDLPHPKQIDEAIPANRRCGRREGADALPTAPQWAPLRYTFAGIWEVEPQWLEEHLHEVQVVDVRDPEEYTGFLGHIQGARLIPLAELNQQLHTLDKDKPIVTVCRAGGRSAQATVLLRRAGFERVANLAGGMIQWRASGGPVAGGLQCD